jgi:hypothetical protein
MRQDSRNNTEALGQVPATIIKRAQCCMWWWAF